MNGPFHRRWPLLSWAEGLIYYLTALVLVVLALGGLFSLARLILAPSGWGAGLAGTLLPGALDRAMIVLMLAELLHTVTIIIRTRVFSHEPFLVVGIIAVTRRILFITATDSTAARISNTVFQRSMIEMGLDILLVLVLAVALRLGRHGTEGRHGEP